MVRYPSLQPVPHKPKVNDPFRFAIVTHDSLRLAPQAASRGYSIVVLGRRVITLLRFAFLRDLPLALRLDFT
jgi:hypothetical protein